jgi:outer membrane protein assembly factor BamB
MTCARRILSLSLLFSCLSTTSLQAAGYSGEIKAIDATKRTITIYVASLEESKSLQLAASVSVTIDGKPGSLEEIQPGHQASATTLGTSTSVTRLRVRTQPIPKPTPKPEPTPETGSTPDPSPRRAADRSTEPDGYWPQILGPARDGQSSETGLNWNWGSDGPKPLWYRSGLGEGFSSVAIAGDKVFTMGTQGNRETVVALDLAGGEIAWTLPTGDKYNEGQGNGPRATPTIDEKMLYALGANGDLACVSIDNGRGVWAKNILREFGGSNITWGISESVLIDGDKLICTPGGSRGTMVALDKRNGNVLWSCQAPGNPPAAYSSAIAVEIDGVPQYVNMVHDRIIGVHAETGRLMWEDRSAVNGTANCSTPLRFGDSIFYSTGYSTGGALVKLTSRSQSTVAEPVYHTREMKNHHGGMVIVGDVLYGCSDPGLLVCLDVATGKVRWQSREPGKGSITYADGHLIVRNEQGPITLVSANPDKYERRAKFETPEQFRSNRMKWSYPVVADRKLFLRDQDTLLVYDLSSR